VKYQHCTSCCDSTNQSYCLQCLSDNYTPHLCTTSRARQTSRLQSTQSRSAQHHPSDAERTKGGHEHGVIIISDVRPSAPHLAVDLQVVIGVMFTCRVTSLTTFIQLDKLAKRSRPALPYEYTNIERSLTTPKLKYSLDIMLHFEKSATFNRF